MVAVMFLICTTGVRAAAPADAFHATAVIPAARRSGITTALAPNAHALLIIAPRFRGSVTPSSPTKSGTPDTFCRTSLSGRNLYGATLSATP